MGPLIGRCRFALLLLLMLAAPSVSRAQTITAISTVAALQPAINSVTAGGIIEMAGGTYAVPATISISGRPRFMIRAATGATVVLSGGGARRILTLSNGLQPVTFEGLTFRDGVDSTAGGVGGVFASSPGTFVRCGFETNGRSNKDSAGGIYVFQSTAFFVDSIWTGNVSRSLGGGMVVDQSTVYIHDSQFLNNRVNFPGHGFGLGGAIHMNHGVLRVTNTRFEGNQGAFAGGAIYAIALFGTGTSDVVVSNSTFINNRAVKASGGPAGTEVGGAVHIEDDTTAKFYNCRFETNSSSQGGGISSYRAVVEVVDSVFQGNQATGTTSDDGLGGAIIALSDETGGLPNRRPMQLTATNTLFQGRFGAVTTTARQGGCLFLGGDANRNWGLAGATQDGSSATNRATVTLTGVVFDDCDVLGDATFPGAGGALYGSLLALTVTDSLIVNSDATGPDFFGVLPGGGGFYLSRDSSATLTRTTFARNSAVSQGGALFVSGGTLNLNQSSLIENTSTNGSPGSAMRTEASPANGNIPDLDMTGLVQSSVVSDNSAASGSGFIYEYDTASSPINTMKYSSNTIFPASGTFFNPNAPSATSVSDLNGLVLHGQPKAPSANTAPGSAPIVGAILAVPPARLPAGASGDSALPTSYLAYAWSGSTATLDGDPRSGNAGLEEGLTGTHTLTVSSTPFTASITDGPLPATVLIANPNEIASGGSTSLQWTTLAGTFLSEGIDQGALSASPLSSGSVSVSPSATGTYRGFLVTEEGGAVDLAIVDITDANDRIFRDGFESGDFSAWSSSSTDGNDLSASPEAVLTDGSFGMKAVVNDTNPLNVEDNSPSAESRYRARFYFDPHGFDPGEGSNHFRIRLLLAFDGAGQRVVTLVLRRLSGVYSLRGRVRLDNGTRADSAFVSISDEPHAIEFDWKHSSTPTANDGNFGLWIDGRLLATLTGLDNNSSTLESTRLGAIAVKVGATGTMYFDEFESRRALYIGLLP